MATTKAYTIIPGSGMITDEQIKKNEQELQDFTKAVKNNPRLFLAITDYSAVDGHTLDGGCCKKIDPKKIQEVLHDFLMLATSGQMKVNGKKNNWSNGFMGSRWCDMNAEDYGMDYIRVAFYSKKSAKEWKHDKPYAIQITCEKAA